jgi:ABC-type transporter Mla subunit MlaD
MGNILQIIALLRLLVSSIVDVNDLIGDLNSLLKKAEQEGRDVTDSELDALNATVAASREKLNTLLQ